MKGGCTLLYLDTSLVYCPATVLFFFHPKNLSEQLYLPNNFPSVTPVKRRGCDVECKTFRNLLSMIVERKEIASMLLSGDTTMTQQQIEKKKEIKKKERERICIIAGTAF